MQKVLLATSFLASANAKAYTKMEAKVNHALDFQRRSIFSAFQKASPAEKKTHTLSAQGFLKKEVSVSGTTKSKPIGKFFEIHVSKNADCTGDMGTHGMETGRCTNGIENFDPSTGKAEAYSEMIYYPNNAGFPILASFLGHDCQWDNLFDTSRFPKTSLGFPKTYVPDYTCESIAPDFNLEAYWSDTRIDPIYPAIMEGFDGKYSDCMKNKYAFYSFEAADTCFSDSNDDGSPTGIFFKYLIDTNCNFNPFGKRFFIYQEFSDSGCNVLDGTPVTKYLSDDCTFDLDFFQKTLDKEEWGNFEYTNVTCFLPRF